VVRKISPLDDKSLFYTYQIIEGEKPEDISYKVYGSTQYYWTIFLTNNLFDVNYDFPLSSLELTETIKEKYGSIQNAYNTPIYWIRPEESKINSDAAEYPDKDRLDNFLIVPDTFVIGGSDYTFSTYPEYSNGVLMKVQQDSYSREIELNEAKRNILLLQKSYLEAFVSEFNLLISQ
jgi:hypothetical protein